MINLDYYGWPDQYPRNESKMWDVTHNLQIELNAKEWPPQPASFDR